MAYYTVGDLFSLGRTGMAISRVGLGTWAIGGPWSFGWGVQDDRTSVLTIRDAVDKGINWIDTAPIYGYGHAEEIIAEALGPIPSSQRPYIFTKCGLMAGSLRDSDPPLQVGNPAFIRAEVDSSLKRLKTDHLDLLQMHYPADDGTKLEDYWSTLLSLKKEGKVRAIGLSHHSVDQLSVAEELGHVDVFQPHLSVLDRSEAVTSIPWCHKNETGVIIYSPMYSGLLSGTFSVARAEGLAPDDWRSRDPEFHGEALERRLAVAASLREVAKRYHTSAGAVAIAWVLHWRGVSGAIVGARKSEQIFDWIGAGQLRLTISDLETIAQAIKVFSSGEGPARPDVL